MMEIGIIGAAGKMGNALIATASPEIFKLHTIVRPTQLEGGAPACTFETTPFEDIDLLIDFSNAASVEKNIEIAVLHKKPLVIGTTGHTESSFTCMELASKTIPLLYSSNFSIGIFLIKTFITHHLPFLS